MREMRAAHMRLHALNLTRRTVQAAGTMNA